MKCLTILAMLLCNVQTSVGWMPPWPDFKEQHEKADLVAVVRVTKVSDSGKTKRLMENTELRFRQILLEFEVVTPLKGKVDEAAVCSLYRFPTKKERVADLGEREAPRAWMMANPWESGIFVPKRDCYYLVYLRKSQDGTYAPLGGAGSAVYSIIELTVPFEFEPDKPNNKTAPANPLPAPSRNLNENSNR